MKETQDHTCAAEKCPNPIPPDLLLCRKHWRMLPEAAKALVKRHYNPAKVGAADPGMEHELAVSTAVAIVKSEEGIGLSTKDQVLVMAFRAASGDSRQKEALDLFLHAEHVGAVVAAGEDVGKDKVVRRAQERRQAAQQAARDRQAVEEASSRTRRSPRSGKRGRSDKKRTEK